MARDLAYWESAVAASKMRYEASVRRAGPTGNPNPVLLRNYMLNVEQLAAFKSGQPIPQYNQATAHAATNIGLQMSKGVSPSFILAQSSVAAIPPPLPHPDASNLALGPNLGGSDAVVDTPTTAGTGAGASGAGGLLLLGVVGVLVFVALRRK